MFLIKFKDEHDKQVYTVHCKTEDLDLRGHPYFVSVLRLIQPTHSPIIAIDNKEKKRFQHTRSLLIPVQNVILIERIEDEKPRLSKVQLPRPQKKSAKPSKNLVSDTKFQN